MNDPLRFAAGLALAIGLASGCDVPPAENGQSTDVEIRMEEGGVGDMPPPDTAGPEGIWAPADLANPPAP